MNSSRHVINLFKLILVIIIDVITVLLVFSIWALINLPLFPVALCVIFISMLIFNAGLLLPSETIQRWGVASYSSLLVATILYYITTIAFTGIVYSTITTRWYLIFSLLFLLVYIFIIAGLYISGLNNREDIIRQATEKKKMLDANMQLMKINDSIRGCRGIIESDKYGTITGEFDLLKERFLASTPFGRVAKPVIIELEAKMLDQLIILNDTILLLKAEKEQKKALEDTLRLISDVKAMVINREKLMIQ